MADNCNGPTRRTRGDDTPQARRQNMRAQQTRNTDVRQRAGAHSANTRQQAQPRATSQRSQQASRSARRPQHSASVQRNTRSRYSVQQPVRTNRKNANRPPLLPVIIALAVVVFAIFVVPRACVPNQQQTTDTPNTQQAASSEQSSSQETVPLEEGRIVITLKGSQDTYVKLGESYIEPGCHVTDKKEGDLTSSVQISGEVDTNTEGEYPVTYTVRNGAGMEASKTRTVHVTSKMKTDKDGISVLMYHYVYTDDDPPSTNDTNYLHADKFEKQLKWLTKNNYYYPSYQELRAYIEGTHSLPKKSVVLTFDDGQKGFLEHGIPLLEKYKVPATSFIICNKDNTKKNIVKYASEYVMFESHSYALHQDGNTNIGRGGRIYDLSKDELVKDFKKAAKILGSNDAFAYPYGDVSDVSSEALNEAGVLCSFTINYSQVHKGDDPTQLGRIRILAESSLDGFIYQVEHGE